MALSSAEAESYVMVDARPEGEVDGYRGSGDGLQEHDGQVGVRHGQLGGEELRISERTGKNKAHRNPGSIAAKGSY